MADHSFARGWIATLLTTSALAGCAPPAADANATAAAVHRAVLPAHVRAMPTRGPRPLVVPAAAGAPQLTYRGGPVLQNVKVQVVFWGSGNNHASELPAFYNAITNSEYFDWLSEYNTDSPSQQIGRGSFLGAFTDKNAPTGSISDGQIQSHLGDLIDQGKVPPPDANTYYAVHFSPKSPLSGGCTDFCGYHGSFAHNGATVFYAALPNIDDSCGGCVGGDFANTALPSSHELIEAVTDADVGQNDLAWYDDDNGEIGDICAWQAGTAAGLPVQLEWSNQANACIDHGQ
jgi:hypothetical protein